MSDFIDATNKFLVATQSDGIIMRLPPTAPMTDEEALNLAAWLVAITGETERFTEVLDAVLDT